MMPDTPKPRTPLPWDIERFYDGCYVKIGVQDLEYAVACVNAMHEVGVTPEGLKEELDRLRDFKKNHRCLVVEHETRPSFVFDDDRVGEPPA